MAVLQAVAAKVRRKMVVTIRRVEWFLPFIICISPLVSCLKVLRTRY